MDRGSSGAENPGRYTTMIPTEPPATAGSAQKMSEEESEAPERDSTWALKGENGKAWKIFEMGESMEPRTAGISSRFFRR